MNYWFLYLLTTGEIYTSPYLGNATEWTNIPAGCAVLGPFDSATASAIVKDVYTHPNYYSVQNGSLVAVANLAQLQLQDAQTAKIASLQQSFDNTFLNGFPSSATGTLITFGCAPLDMQNIGDELNSVNAGIATYPITWMAFDGVTAVSFTTAAQFKQLAQDAYNFKWAQISNLRTKITNTKAATTVTAVNAIVW